MPLAREELAALIQRSLGIKHKLKVHESLDAPQTHEDLAVMLLAKWDLEDELRAIEEILGDARRDRIDEQKGILKKDILNLIEKQTAKRKAMSSSRKK